MPAFIFAAESFRFDPVFKKVEEAGQKWKRRFETMELARESGGGGTGRGLSISVECCSVWEQCSEK